MQEGYGIYVALTSQWSEAEKKVEGGGEGRLDIKVIVNNARSCMSIINPRCACAGGLWYILVLCSINIAVSEAEKKAEGGGEEEREGWTSKLLFITQEMRPVV